MKTITPNIYYFIISFTIITMVIGWLKKEKKIIKILTIITFLLLLLSVFEPIFTFYLQKQGKIILLIDSSKSMGVGGRWQEVKKIVKKLKKITSEIYTFDTKLTKVKDTLPSPTGEGTNLKQAFEKLPPASCYLLISDGRTTTPEDPLPTIQKRNTPVYPIKIKNPLPQDVTISFVDYPPITYLGDTITVKIGIKNTSYQGKHFTVTLNNMKKTGMFKTESGEEVVEFQIVPQKIGINSYPIKVEKLPEELFTTNNQKVIKIKTLSPFLTICWLSLSPTWNFKFCKKEISKNPDWEFEFWVKLKEGKWLTHKGIKEKFTPNYPNYDIIIVDNSPQIKNLPLTKKLIIIGKPPPSLPITLKPTPLSSSPSFIKVLPNYYSLFPKKKLPPLTEILPPLSFTSFTPLCETPSKIPIILQKSNLLLVLAKDLWKWHLKYNLTPFTSLIHYLSLPPQKLYINLPPIIPISSSYPIKIHSLTPLPTPPTLKISPKHQPHKTISLPLHLTSPLTYQTTLPPLPKGTYLYTLSPHLTGEFSITSDMELDKISTNTELLKRIANITKGKYITNISTLTIPISPLSSKSPLTPTTSPITLTLLLLLLSLQYLLLRKFP